MIPISNTNSFSLRRLVKVIGIDLRAYSFSRRMYIGIIFIFLATQVGALNECVAFYKIGKMESTQILEHFTFLQVPLFYCFLFGMMLFSIASMMHLGDKSDAIYYLTLPASSKEKFVSNAILAVIEPIIMTSLTMFVADLVRIGVVEYRMAVNPNYAVLTSDFHGLTLPHLFDHLQRIVQHCYHLGGTDIVNAEGYISMGGVGFSALRGILMILFCVMSVLFVHSLFLLAGSYCPNLTAIGILVVGSTLLLLKGRAIDAVASTGEVTISVYGNLLHHEVLSIALLIFFATLTIVNWRLSYRAFTRRQVVMPENFLSKIFTIRKEEAV